MSRPSISTAEGEGQQVKNNSVVIGSPLTGSVGSPTVDRQVAQIIRPLRVVVEEVRALREMGKETISKHEAAVRRLLNALHRVFTVGVTSGAYGSFWDFLVAVEEQITRQQVSFSDRIAKDITSAKDRVASRVRLPSYGPNGLFSHKDDGNNNNSIHDAPTSNPSSANRFVSASRLSAAAPMVNSYGFPLPTVAQERALVRSIEVVRSCNMQNKLNALHYWIIVALQQGGVLPAVLTCAVVPMCDVLQAYMGPESPFYAKQSATLAKEEEEGSPTMAALCYPFLHELLKVFEDLETHPDMGPIQYALDITSLQLFQTVTDSHGHIIIGVNGADNNEPVSFYTPNLLNGATGNSRGGRNGTRRRAATYHRKLTKSIGTETDFPLSLASSSPSASSPYSPLASRHNNRSDAVDPVLAPMLMSNAAAVTAFFGGSGARGGSANFASNNTTSGGGGIAATTNGDDGGIKGVMSFTELCQMQNALLEDQRQLKERDMELTEREREITEKERDVQDAAAEIIEVVLKLKDLYHRHVVGIRERQEMGLRVTAKDIDRKVPQLLRVFEEDDFDMVADEDELNAAGLVRSNPTSNSQRRLVESATTSDPAMGSAANSSSTSNRHRSTTVVGGGVVVASSPSAPPPTLVGGVKPLVIDEPDDGVPPCKVAGLIALLTSEPRERSRDDQLKTQHFLCADCGTSFGGEGTNNVLLKTFQKTSEILTMQKPRRCHYCTQLLCHSCHSNQTALLPFRVIPKWDFANKHVCKRCHTFLQQNYTLAHYDFRKIPREIAMLPSLAQCAQVRKYLMRASLIISGCTRPSSASFAQDLHTHYFQREFFYSMHDLSIIHSCDKRGSNPAHIVPGVSNVVGAMQWVAGVSVENLVDSLTGKLALCKQHIKIDCANCKTRSSMPCQICNVTTPVFVVDEDGTQCRKCHTIYHVKCFDLMGCPSCAVGGTEVARVAK